MLEEHKPILYVSHDEDGYWQFLCGGSHKEDAASDWMVKCTLSEGMK